MPSKRPQRDKSGSEDWVPPPPSEEAPAPRRKQKEPALETTGAAIALMNQGQAGRKWRGWLGVLAAMLLVAGAGFIAISERREPPVAKEPAPPPEEAEPTTGAPSSKEKRQLSRALTGGPRSAPVKKVASAEKPAQEAEELPPTPSVELGTGRMRSLAPEDLARAIAQDKGGAIQLCYERELKRSPRLKGRVVVALDLVAPQKVAKVDVRDNLRRPTFTTCVHRAMKKIFFPTLREDLSIEIPFDLKAPAF